MPPTLLRTLFSGSGGWTYGTAVAAPSPPTHLRVSPRIHQRRDVPATRRAPSLFKELRLGERTGSTGLRLLCYWAGATWAPALSLKLTRSVSSRGSIGSMWRGHALSVAPGWGLANRQVHCRGARGRLRWKTLSARARTSTFRLPP